MAGDLAPASTMRVSVVLRSKDPSGLEEYAAEASTPGSPLYRQFLTPEQVQARFGPSPDVLSALRSWLGDEGLHVEATIGDGLVVPATGPASTVQSAFATQIHQFDLPNGRHVFANTEPASVPASLAPEVLGVGGLDDVAPPPSPDPVPGADLSNGPNASPDLSHAPTGGPMPCPDAVASGGSTADQLANLYDVSPLYRDGDFGQGVSVGLVAFWNEDPLGTAAFDACYGIQTSVTPVLVDGGPTSEGLNFEADLDLQSAAEMAPDAHIVMYEGNFDSGTLDAILDVYATMAQQDRVQVISTSVGSGCEPVVVQNIGLDYVQAENAVFQVMAAQGQSFLAASGDDGSIACYGESVPNPDGLAVNDPASQPFVTGVGGTQVVGGVESAAGLSGGGISELWPQPSWQVGADTSGNASGLPCGAPAGINCREVPDVSALAGTPGYAVNYGGDWYAGFGTSGSSPLWAGLVALFDEGAPRGRLGLLNPALYRLASTIPSAFHDMTVGQNSIDGFLVPPGTNSTCTYNGVPDQPCYEATPGYDMVSGLGSPDAAVLAGALDAGSAVTLEASAAQVPLGRPVTLSATVRGIAPTGTVTFSDGGATLGSAALVEGSAGLTTSALSVGTHTLSATYGGDGANGPATSVPITVTVLGAQTASASVAATPDGTGYWVSGPDGSVTPFGSASGFGSMAGRPLNQPVVGIASTPDGKGYWLVASDGGIFCFGDAGFFGSLGNLVLNRPIVGLAATGDGKGYWLVAADGGVFAFGDAPYLGSMGAVPLNAPIVGMAPTGDGLGYWLVASDGGVFSFGDAGFFGSLGSLVLNRPIVGLTATSDGAGYWLVAADGGVFAEGDAPYYGSTGDSGPGPTPVIALFVSQSGLGYRLIRADGTSVSFGS